MYMGSMIEDSFNIAWSFLERSGELGEADACTGFLVRFIEDQIRAGERRPMMIANRAIVAYQSRALKPKSIEKRRSFWIA
ncbi:MULTISPECIES: hypothetical protein [unclassified Bradyrhizobium]|uniref:hypothetical protein n=1 Tax=unclassified Bradyrhizobium TaxID=2631580 RepID=UPI0020B45718|nr:MULTISPECIES: hypothetical protein [unclassified Bradyrhizobium]MCP3401963.1 hypothetical protein [Bradyrhizobium sp. CCGB20]MCP3410448.1 hypothetical protein [Bradyrhizobium sp. CCGB01]